MSITEINRQSAMPRENTGAIVGGTIAAADFIAKLQPALHPSHQIITPIIEPRVRLLSISV